MHDLIGSPDIGFDHWNAPTIFRRWNPYVSLVLCLVSGILLSLCIGLRLLFPELYFVDPET